MRVKEELEIINPILTAQEMKKICQDYLNSDVNGYDEFIKKYENEKVYLLLSDIGENILNWYDFSKNSKVLEISYDFGQITNLLLKNELNVTRFEFEKVRKDFITKRFKNNSKLKVKDLFDIEKEDEKYDYIIFSNVLDVFEDCNEMFNILLNLLNKDGKFIVIFENPNSVNSYSISDNKDGTLKVLRNNGKFNIENLELYLSNTNLKYKNIYYSFPNSYIPSIIYEENYLKENLKQISYPIVINDTDIVIADENNMINQIMSQNSLLMKYFANSYIIEASREEIKNDSLMISFNNYRKKEYELITILKNDKVFKIPKNKESESHIENMKKGIYNLKKINKSFIDDINKNGQIYSDYIKNYETLDNIIFKEYQKNKDLEKVAEIYKDSYKILENELVEFSKVEKNELLNEIPEENLNKMRFLKNCPWDMIAKNCFLINGEYLYFDQEWFENGLPIEFLIYRSIINSYDLIRNIDIHDLLKLLKIDEYFEYFEKVNEKLRNEILNQKILKLYENKNVRIDNLLYSVVELNICKNNLNGCMENNLKQDKYIKSLESELEKYKTPTIKRFFKKFFLRGRNK